MYSVLVTIASAKAAYLVSVNDPEGENASSSKNIRIDYSSYDELKSKLKKLQYAVETWGTTDKAAETVPDFSVIGKTLIGGLVKQKTIIEKNAPFMVEILGDIHVLLVKLPSPEIDMVI